MSQALTQHCVHPRECILSFCFSIIHIKYIYKAKVMKVGCGVSLLASEVYLFGLSGYIHPSKDEAIVPRFREL